MSSKISLSKAPGEHADWSIPYPPSMVDHFMAWVERLPGPVWLFYLVLLAVGVVLFNGAAWLAGAVPYGTFDLYRTSIPFYPVAVLALIHYLNRVAQRALAAFHPALGATDAEYARFAYELTTLPRRQTWWAVGWSLPFTTAYSLFTPAIVDTFRRWPGLVAADTLVYGVVFALIAVFVYHTYRHLRLVSRIHASAKNVNLFQLTPLYAFSWLTAQTGMGLLLLNYFSILTDPATFTNPALLGLTIFASLAAVACFVLPLKGMHDRIVLEKKRLRAEVNTRLEAAIQQIYRRADTQDLTGVDQLHQLLASLITAREVVDKIPTWPWDLGALTGFLSAFLLPFVIRVIIEVLENLGVL